MHVVGGGGVEGGGDSGEGVVAVAFAEGGFLLGFAGGGFEFEPGCEAGEEAAEGFEVGSDGAGLGLAGGGFDGHFLAEIAFFEGLQDWVGDQLYLLEPVVAVLFCCGAVSWVRVSVGGRLRSGGETAEEEAAAIRV